MNSTGEEEPELLARSYQTLLINQAIRANSIIYLPTGAGKTFCAIEVIKYFGRDLEKSIDEGGRRTVFMVNTNALAIQQANVLSKVFPYDVGLFTGEQNIDMWHKKDWEEKLEKHQIIVATAQVILNAVTHGFVPVSIFNVMIFDECHKASQDENFLELDRETDEYSILDGEHPMHEIMKELANVDLADQPRIIGLSGMLLGATIKPQNIRKELQKLESTLNSSIITVNNIAEHKNVLLYSTCPREATYTFIKELPTLDTNFLNAFVEDVKSYLKSMDLTYRKNQDAKTLKMTGPKPIKTCIKLFDDFKYELNDIGLVGGVLSLLSLIIEFEIKKKGADSKELQSIYEFCITKTEMLSHLLYNYMKHDSLDAEKILYYSSEKVKLLIKFIKQKFNDPNRDEDLQCIVFVDRRYTAKVLYHLLKEYAKLDKDFPVIPDFMVGNSGHMPESIENILYTTNYRKALNRFRNQETNCIVSSSVLQEGIDVQSCNLVIMFDKPECYPNYIQTKGRARHKTSDYVVLLNKISIADFQKKQMLFDQIDQELKKILIVKTIDRLEVDACSIEKERQYEWPPYETIAGAKLTGTMAISIIHRYASLLPNDIFTNVNIYYDRVDLIDGKFKVGLQLPIQSKIKEKIWSDPMDNVKLAKQQVCFKACILLHQAGELNDHLLPVESDKKIEDYNHEYFQHWEKYEKNQVEKRGAGISKKRIHKIKIPNEMVDCAPKVGEYCFLYPIKIQPKFVADVETLKVFLELYKKSTTYGILTTKRIPKLCSMRFFQSYGEVDLSLEDEPLNFRIENQAQLKLLQNFHIMIFRDILHAWQSFFVLDYNSILIVPLENNKLNWNLVGNFQKLDPPPSYENSGNKIATREEIEHKVISPHYRDKNEFYIVTHCREDLSPLSEFPSTRSPTYKDYFENTYGVEVKGLNQFLVEVRGVTRNLNLLFPGGGSSGKKRKTDRGYQQEIYIPEICHNFGFPGDYWLKATLLPVFLHRMQYLLLAEHLRVYLMEKIGIGNPRIPQKYELDIDCKSLEERQAAENEYLKHYKEHCGIYGTSEEILKRVQEATTDKKKRICFTENALFIDEISMPIDIDRNWSDITPLDIDNYVKFCSDNRTLVSTTSVGFSKFQLSPKRNLLQVCDRNHKKIRIIQLNSNYCETPQQKDLIKVLTTSKSSDVFDMERYEVLGDGFLKLAVSLYLYKKYDDWHEGYLTSLKGKIVSNRNLFYCGNDFGISGMIKFSQFQPKSNWLPPCIGMPRNVLNILREERYAFKALEDLKLKATEVDLGILSNENLENLGEGIQKKIENAIMFNQTSDDEIVDSSNINFMGEQYFKDKIVADCMEALIGVCVNSVGLKDSMKLLNHFEILPRSENLEHLMSEPIQSRTLRPNIQQSEVLRLLIDYKKCEKIIGYNFKDRSFLLQALTHASYPKNNITGCYQQLEFLGDAILDFLITSYIFEQCPDMDPGRLTDLRSALVNNVTLASVIVRHKLHKFLLSQNHLLSETIAAFVSFQEVNQNTITEQIEVLVNEDDKDAVANSIEVPKVLGDIFESIVGAIFLDSGMNFETVWGVVYSLLELELTKFMQDVPKQLVRRLFEYPGAEPKFFKPDKIGDKVYVPLTFQINNSGDVDYVIGIGNNVKSAKKAAAKIALRKLYKSREIKLEFPLALFNSFQTVQNLGDKNSRYEAKIGEKEKRTERKDNKKRVGTKEEKSDGMQNQPTEKKVRKGENKEIAERVPIMKMERNQPKIEEKINESPEKNIGKKRTAKNDVKCVEKITTLNENFKDKKEFKIEKKTMENEREIVNIEEKDVKDEEFFKHWEKYEQEDDNAKKDAGLSRKRIHKIRIPQELVNCHPKIGQECYLYPIKFESKLDPKIDTKFFENSSTFGILTAKLLPRLCEMKFYKSYGEILVKIQHQPISIHIKSESQLKLLRNFHLMIFRDLLKTWQPFFVHEFESLLVVPLKNEKIQWKFIEGYQKTGLLAEIGDLGTLKPLKKTVDISEMQETSNFPGEYLQKSTLLPSIFHRIHYLLLSDNLRVQLLDKAGIGNPKIQQDYKFYENDPEISKITQKTENLKISSKTLKNLSILQLTNHSRTLQQNDVIQVLTTSKSGDIFDMERFEVLGDAYLKYTTSLFLYKNYPEWNEGQLTALKGKIVSNRNLYYCGNDLGLPELIKYSNFLPAESWVPPCFGVPKNILELISEDKGMFKFLSKLTLSKKEVETGNLNKENLENFQQAISKERKENRRFIGTAKEEEFDPSYLIFTNEQYFPDKIVSDCLEALLGASVNSIGIKDSLNLLKYFKILPEFANLENLLTEKISSRLSPQKISQVEVLRKLENHKKLEHIICYKFFDKSYLLLALSHASHPLNPTIGCYQELEFLGDAILDFLITCCIFEHCPDMDPGQLTDLRSALVNNETLGSILVRHQLQNFIFISNPSLSQTVETFVNYQKTNKHLITDQILMVPGSKDTAECVEVPKVLGDVFESIIGAIYLDSGMNLETVWKTIYSLMKMEIHEFMQNVPKQLSRELFEYPKADAKFHNFEKIGDKIKIPLSFKINEEIVTVFGLGNNNRSAKKAASKLAIKKLDEAEKTLMK